MESRGISRKTVVIGGTIKKRLLKIGLGTGRISKYPQLIRSYSQRSVAVAEVKYLRMVVK